MKTKPPPQPHGNPDCIAILREDGDVDVYDVAGDCMTFRAPITTDGSSNNNPNKLCFSSHGHDDIDRYLTPCFDEEGNLGDPEEDCHCGAEGPHLHAHLHNDTTCRDDLHANQKFQLASVTLQPKVVEMKKVLPASASLPNTCNSSQVAQSLSERGMDAQKYHASKQRLTTKISHEDHVDVLVHNPETGLVTLEHDCLDCGNMDVHGTLAYAAQRSFHADEVGERKIQINFYEIPKTPLRLLDVLAGFFAMEDDKAHVMRSAFPTTASPTKTKPACCKDGTCTAKEGACPSVTTVASDLEYTFEGTVKSTLHVKGICCAAEIPMVNSIVEPLKGVTNVSVVTTTKLVHVTHDPTLITAQQVMRALNKQKFNASVKKDGGGKAPKMIMTSDTTFGRSTFFVSGICCAAEIPAINNILEPLKGVQKVSINVPNKMVYVEHEFDLISATAIKEALDQERFFTKVEKDAQAETAATGFMSKYVESTFLVYSFFEHTDANRVKLSMREHFSKEQLSHCEVHVPSKTIKIDHNPKLVSADDLAKFLQDSAGLDLALIADGFKEGIWSAPEDDLLEEEHAHLQWPVVFSGIFWIVSMLHFIGGNWDYLKYAGILSVLLGITKIASKAFLTMKRGQFDTNCMMLFATLGELQFRIFYPDDTYVVIVNTYLSYFRSSGPSRIQ
jgi:copper chaperone CopZ